MNAIRFFIVITLAIAAAAPAVAQVHDIDIILRRNNGHMETGADINGSLVFPHRVYAATFGEGGIDDFTDEPGYDSDPVTSGLTPGSRVGFNFLSALRVWNGTNFDTVALPQLRVTFGPLQAMAPASDGAAPGLGVSVSAAGTYHNHFGYRLVSTAMPPAVPAEAGIYALKLEAVANDGSLPSLPYWLVLNQNSDLAQVEAALQWLDAGLRCRADVAGLGGTPGADGQLTADDVVVYLGAFFAGDLAIADIASLGGGENPDGQLTADDVVAFLGSFFGGCGN